MSTLSNSPSPEHRRHHPGPSRRASTTTTLPPRAAPPRPARRDPPRQARSVPRNIAPGSPCALCTERAFAGTLRAQVRRRPIFDRHCRRRTTPDLTECQAAAQVGGRLHGDASAARLGVTHRSSFRIGQPQLAIVIAISARVELRRRAEQAATKKADWHRILDTIAEMADGVAAGRPGAHRAIGRSNGLGGRR